MKTDTSIDPIPPILDYLLDEDPGVDDRIYGGRFPDPLTYPAVCIQFVGTTSTYIRVQVIVKAVDVPGTPSPGSGIPAVPAVSGQAKAVEVWLAVDELLNFWAAPICGLNNGFIQREEGSPRVNPEANTDATVVAAYYLVEMGG
jgi:hypothetical protein